MRRRTGVDSKNMKCRRRKGPMAKSMSKLALVRAVEPPILALALPRTCVILGKSLHLSELLVCGMTEVII